MKHNRKGFTSQFRKRFILVCLYEIKLNFIPLFFFDYLFRASKVNNWIGNSSSLIEALLLKYINGISYLTCFSWSYIYLSLGSCQPALCVMIILWNVILNTGGRECTADKWIGQTCAEEQIISELVFKFTAIFVVYCKCAVSSSKFICLCG